MSARSQLKQCRRAPAKPLRSPDVIYVPTPPEVVDAMLTVANVRRGDVLYDLGSGDGRIPITAVQKYNVTRATGIEINPERIVGSAAESAEQRASATACASVTKTCLKPTFPTPL